MKQDVKKPGGPLLDKPSIALPKPAFLSSFAFYFALLLLGAAGAMGSFFTAFSIQVNLASLLPIAVLCALVCTAQFFLPKYGWLLGLLGAVIWAFLLWASFDSEVEAVKRVVNEVSFAYSEKLNFTLPYFITDTIFPDREKFLFTLFAFYLEFPLFWILSWVLIRQKSCVGSFLVTLFFLLFPMIFGILPETWALGALLLFWAFLLLSASNLRQRRLLVEDRGSFHTTGTGFAQASALLLLPAIALCMVLIWFCFPKDTYVRPQAVNDLRTSFTQSLNLPSVFRDGIGSGNQQVDLSSLGERSYTGKTVLRVKRDWADSSPDEYLAEEIVNGVYTGQSWKELSRQKEYLKSFVGSVYTGRSWERLSRKDAAEAAELLGELKAQTMSSALRRFLPIRDKEPHSPYTLSVQEIDVNPQCVFTPYGLRQEQELPEKASWVDDSFVESSQWFGSKSYSLSADSLPPAQFQTDYLVRFDSYVYRLFQERKESEGMSQELAQVENAYTNSVMVQEADGHDLYQSPQEVKALLEPETQRLTEAAEAYAPFVYDHYTRLPEGLKEFLQGYLAEHDLPLQAGMKDAFINSVRELLREEYSYSLSPPSLPAGEDFVEFFLSESKEGYCVHFASAAVALFRAAGIPARYAEGYAAPTKDGVWTDVPDRNAHAWAEVWFGGAGWIPVEVTPAGPDAPAAYENAIGPTDSTEPGGPTPKPTMDPAQQSPQNASPMPGQAIPTPLPGTLDNPGGPEDPNGDGAASPVWLPWAVLGGCLLLPILLAWVSRLLRLHHRKGEFAQADRNKAALCAYAHILRLHHQCAAVVIHVSVDPPKELEDLALKARFSTHMLSQEELKQLLSYAKSVEHKMKVVFRRPRLLYCKYILALF